MMSVKEMVLQELDTLDDSTLEQVADYLSFLKFRARKSAEKSISDSLNLAQLYADAAKEDRELAEQGMSEYQTLLFAEDMR